MTPQDYNKQFDELIDSINKLRSDINKHFDQPGKMVGWKKVLAIRSEHRFDAIVHTDGYGLNHGGLWTASYNEAIILKEGILCHPEEVEAMLIAEAKKRGLVHGAMIVTAPVKDINSTNPNDHLMSGFFAPDGPEYKYDHDKNILYLGRGAIFCNGWWAEECPFKVVKPSYTIQGDTISGLTEEQIQKVKEVLS